MLLNPLLPLASSSLAATGVAKGPEMLQVDPYHWDLAASPFCLEDCLIFRLLQFPICSLSPLDFTVLPLLHLLGHVLPLWLRINHRPSVSLQQRPIHKPWQLPYIWNTIKTCEFCCTRNLERINRLKFPIFLWLSLAGPVFIFWKAGV